MLLAEVLARDASSITVNDTKIQTIPDLPAVAGMIR